MKKISPSEIKLEYGELAPEVVLPPGDRFELTVDEHARAMYHKEKAAMMLIEASRTIAYRDMIKIRTEESGYDREGHFVPVRIYYPAAKGPRPIIVFFHGGGWILNDINVYEWVCRYLAFKSDAVVLSVDYRLAPQDKFPAGLNDCYGALEWAFKNAGTFNGDISNVSIAGDSAGGNYATVCTIMARDNGLPELKNQILMYPATDLTDYEYYSYGRYAKGYFIEWETPNPVFSLYLDSPEQANDPRVSPVLTQNLKGLPRTMFISAECDPIVDQAVRYAGILDKQGVEVDFYLFEGVQHGFVTGTMKTSFQAMDLIAEAIGN